MAAAIATSAEERDWRPVFFPIARMAMMMAEQGPTTHFNSESAILSPQGEKARRMLMGPTIMGRHGRKYLVLLNGEKNAMPRPPSVIASSNPCDAQARNRYNQVNHL